MAKLNSKRFREVARISTTLNGARYLWVMRSDGKVLRRCTAPNPTAYTIKASCVPPRSIPEATTKLETLATDSHHEIVR